MNKTIITLTAVAFLAFPVLAADMKRTPSLKDTPNAEPSKDKATAKSTATWISKIDVAVGGAVKTEEIDGESQFGTLVDVGVGVNKFVSIHASALTYEGDDEWRGGSIDEVSLGVQASLSRFSTESFLPYVIANGVRSFGDSEDWAISLGLGAKIQFNDYLALGGDYNLRAWFNGPEDSLARLYLQYSF